MHRGDVVAGRYEVGARQRSGGMADIYHGVDRRTNAVVAIKVLRTVDPKSIARFEREASIMARLDHTAIVPCRDYGRTADGDYYLVMDWLDGEDLHNKLHRSDLTLGETLRIGARIASALAVAHDAGVVHRDIKPSNVFLPDGKMAKAVLIDFGIASLQSSRTIQTDPAITMGSPGYMSPEQAETGKPIGPSSDIYSLGCVLFRCLTGRKPFTGDSPVAIMVKTVIELAPRVSDFRDNVPAELDDLIASMLAKNVDDRPTNATMVARSLARIAPVGLRPRARRTTPAITAGEQRIVSIAMTDLRIRRRPGMLSRARTEEPAILMGVIREVIPELGGSLAQLSDGIVVVSLEGHAAKEQPGRAARCALAMRELLEGAPIVLATGRGNVSPLPMGEVIDRAVALLQNTKTTASRDPTVGPDDIRIDEVTASLLDSHFLIEQDELGAYLLEERTVEAARTLLGQPTPFVGRVRELGFLEAIFDETLQESTANAALVTAAAGIGKSRLRYEFMRQLRRRRRPIEQWIGRGDPIGAGSAFATIAPAIRREAGFVPGEPDDDRRDKLRERLARHLGGETLRRVSTFLGELVGLRMPTKTDIQLRAARSDPILMGDQMRRAWLDWLAAELDQQPVVLVLEDLHWGDRPSISFVDEALRRFHDRPLMVLALARPEVNELFPKLWSDRPLTRIELRELSRTASSNLIREVLGDDVEPRTIDVIVERAQGNAFYLEELIRAVAEGRSTELPDSILTMVQSRLEGLDADARRILRAAAVFGRDFVPTGVRTLLGGPGKAPHVRSKLQKLAEIEVVTRRRDAQTEAGDIVYTFRHALLREAAYATLTEEDRVLGHRLAGTWLEGLGQSDAIVLAEHFERGEQPRRALTWYRKAAEQALEGNDFDATIERCERGIACGASGSLAGALHVLQAEAARWQGRHADCIRYGKLAMKLLPAGTGGWLQAAGLVSISAGNTAEPDELVSIGNALSGLGADDTDVGGLIVALSRTADRLMILGRYQFGDSLVARIDELQDHPAAGEPAVAGWVHRIRAWQGMFRGDPATLTLEMMRAADSFERAGDYRNACLQRGNAGYGYLHAGDYERAKPLLRGALRTAEQLQLGNVITSVSVDLGLSLALSGDVDEAIAVLEDVSARCVDQGIARLEVPVRAYLALCLSQRDQFDRALDEAGRAVDLTATNPPARALALAALAAVHLRRNELDDALRAANKAMGQLQSLGGVNEGESMVRITYAEALLASGQDKAAREAVLMARKRLYQRADGFGDASFRTCFLENDFYSAKTHALARRLGVPRTDSDVD